MGLQLWESRAKLMHMNKQTALELYFRQRTSKFFFNLIFAAQFHSKIPSRRIWQGKNIISHLPLSLNLHWNLIIHMQISLTRENKTKQKRQKPPQEPLVINSMKSGDRVFHKNRHNSEKTKKFVSLWKKWMQIKNLSLP